LFLFFLFFQKKNRGKSRVSSFSDYSLYIFLTILEVDRGKSNKSISSSTDLFHRIQTLEIMKHQVYGFSFLALHLVIENP